VRTPSAIAGRSRRSAGATDNHDGTTVVDGVTPVDLIIVLVVALRILGPGKLPETGAVPGKAVREFRNGLNENWTTTPAGTDGASNTNAPSPKIPPTGAP
jgi:TatA/E family protein of Tat protein translocase